MSTHVITGGTGFFGTSIILELLQQTDADLLCLVRPGRGEESRRLYQKLFNAIREYRAGEHLVTQMKKRCHVLPFDLAHPQRDLLSLERPGEVEQFWHSAASLQFEDWHQDEIFAANVEGTQRALDLARHWKAKSFNHISSIAVSGKRTGMQYEEYWSEQEAKNQYERSKMLAEELVAQTNAFHTRIFRLGGVIGHSKTYAASGTNAGFYGTIQQAFHFKPYLTTSYRTVANPLVPVHMTPVDQVARQAIKIAKSHSAAPIFHLTNSTPPTGEQCIRAICQEMGIPEPEFVTSKEGFTELDHLTHQVTDFFYNYSTEMKWFDRSQSNAALEDEHAGEFLLDEKELACYVRWYYRFLSETSPATTEA
jgi:thioester reductase-like protein